LAVAVRGYETFVGFHLSGYCDLERSGYAFAAFDVDADDS